MKRWISAAGAVIVALAASVLMMGQAWAHGTTENPPSRALNCFLEGAENPTSAACQAAHAVGGAQPFYDWNEISIGDAADRHRELIPDGELCSAGNAKYAGFDLARADWSASILPDGGPFTFSYRATAPHSTKYFDFYVTKDGYDPTQPLAWDDLEAAPFCRITDPTLADGRYALDCELPAGKDGRHVIYSIWQRDDSPEAFYACSDVIFSSDGTVPTSTPLPTLPPQEPTCSADAWLATAVYVEGDLVVHNGYQWRAKWWTQGEEPGTTGQWGVWEEVDHCHGHADPTATATPDAELTAEPTSTPVAPTATATPHDGTCSAAPWQSAAVYVGGDLVAHNGVQWRAQWWTQGEEPGTTGQWGVWESLGACTGEPVATSTPTSTPTTAPTGAPTALPTATATPSPVATATPTTPADGTCSVAAWDAGAVYVAGDRVAHNGRQWQAGWWTQGEEPGTTGQWGVWKDQGACTGEPVATSTPTSSPSETPTAAPTTTPIATPTASPTATPSPTAVPTGDKEIIGYFAQWGIYGRNFLVKDLVANGSAEKLTIINYAFANVVDGECVMTTQPGVMDAYADYQKSFAAAQSVDGVADTWNQPLRGNFNQLRELKAQYPHLRVLISVGGWTWSKGFHDAAMTDASRQRVVESCIDIYIRGNLPVADGAGGVSVAAGVFDGIDIDWEYPANPGDVGTPYGPEDTRNFTLLLAEFRRQLDAIDPALMLTVATGAGVDKADDLELDQIADYLDYVNIMTYDFHGAWEGTTNHQAALYGNPNDPSPYPVSEYNVDRAIQTYIAGGVPAEKIVMGIPFYGRGWTGVTNADNGLYQPAAGAAPGTYEAGIEDTKVLKQLPYPKFRDPVSKAMWVFDGSTFWSYDDEQVIADKMGYINTHNLGGAMVWSLDGDDADATLLGAVYQGLNGAQGSGALGTSDSTAPTNAVFLPLVLR